MLRMTRMMLPTKKLPMMAQATSGWSRNSSGPGISPLMVNAPAMIATVAEVGMPRVNSGIIDDTASALFAASGPATPSTAPVPNSCGRLESFFSIA